MGEIILSIVIGSCLVVSGIILNVTLDKEAKKWQAEEESLAHQGKK